MIKIVTDVSALIPKAKAKKYNITIVPLTVTIGDKTYQDPISINGKQLIDFMNTHKKPFPKTSQPSVGLFLDAYNKLTADGNQVLSIQMTKLLSGTVDAAREAARLCKGKVTVIDSQYIDQSMGHMVLVAAKMAQSGKYTMDQILDKLNKVRDKSELYIGASTLDNLVKGGRISRATGFLTHLLNLHVVFTLSDKDLHLDIKGRGKKTFYRWFKRFIKHIKGTDLSFIGISYTGSTVFPKFCADHLHEMYPDLPISFLYTSAIVSNHTGNNAFAVMICKK
ncbi:DegV family protein [Acetilactobacillus jinshanensis]|uniref:DegV family protein n=1 Tax=Acetilactobacillus jinshanensis TaxID=1720083 RepID=A0A4P6ZJU9_9LACO|nr:DegV family protein [Acetilactobacillus jinshanensis]QBP17767.1 DegV family protein [Acetilactobacillus jinshanensis]URL60629.1 DegV family protein [uncultured bacterium]